MAKDLTWTKLPHRIIGNVAVLMNTRVVCSLTGVVLGVLPKGSIPTDESEIKAKVKPIKKSQVEKKKKKIEPKLSVAALTAAEYDPDEDEPDEEPEEEVEEELVEEPVKKPRGRPKGK